jgi:hypothetical protein
VEPEVEEGDGCMEVEEGDGRAFGLTRDGSVAH